MYKVISIDDEKEKISGYSPEKANEFHTESARNANKKFQNELKQIKSQNKKVVLMCGGSASGKTEFIGKIETKKKVDVELIFDSTLPTIKGAKIKIEAIKKSGNLPVIWFILPDSLSRCFSAFTKRDRKIPESKFYETHSGARDVTLFLAKNCPDIEILIYQNQNRPYSKKDNLPFVKIEFTTRNEMIKFLQKIQLSKEEIKASVMNNL